MYSIGQFSKKIGKSIETLRLWDKRVVLKPTYIAKVKERLKAKC
jgi:DNA-binding transcriptional MerR regulator